ncbi:MAG TPA: AAA family ATPase [Ktedonobacterales bacterium]|jgi:DNA-binding CsgD family transcriptional regulator
MAGNLLERERELTALDTLLGETAAGQGRIALVTGEAGIGKTALVEHFLAQAREQRRPPSRVLWAACEALFTPRPLGPLYDIAQQTPTPLRALLEGDANRSTLFTAVLDELVQAPTILVVEDIHWADEATLDLLKYLARRIHRTAALLILTYRDDEVSRDHPLRLVLGDLPTRDVTRLRLLPLSEAAVTILARQAGRPTGQLFDVTGGNPFFLTEVLASDAPGTPTSVSEAVLGRIARHTPTAQRLMDLVAVVPNQIEQWVISAVGAEDAPALDECIDGGMLHLESGAVRFRHELARLAVEGALSPARRQALHARILRALLERATESALLARLAHHAAAAEDAALVLRFAPEAARQASARGAHREAMAHYQTALRYADRLELEQRAELLDEASYEAYLTEHMEEAIALCAAALTLWRALDRTEQIGHDLRLLATYHWVVGKHVDFERYALEAVAILESASAGHELAMAYAVLANVHMDAADGAATEMWGNRAIELAERLHDAEPISDALNSMGCSEYGRGADGGHAKLERSLALALEYGLEKNVARAYANLATYLVRAHNYAHAKTYLEDGIAYCVEHDLDVGLRTLQGDRARARMEQGDLAGANDEAKAILSVPWVSVANRTPALIVLGQLQARCGDPSAEMALDQARDLALATSDIQYIAPMAAARAEWRWLQGDYAGCVFEADVGLGATPHLRLPRYDGALAVWLWRCGAPTPRLPNIPLPYSLEIAGDWRAAADEWEHIGCPYEQALALLHGDEAAQREALALFERLGALPAAEIARRSLRERGARGLHRGPHPQTRANPQGLTSRQLEVLPLLAEGLHNAEIAERLSTSPRTVEHHVSAVLAKLDARSRAEAVRRAYELGLLAQPSPTGAAQ